MQDSIETAEDVSLLISPPEQSILTSIDILPTIDSPNVNNVHGEKPRASQKKRALDPEHDPSKFDPSPEKGGRRRRKEKIVEPIPSHLTREMRLQQRLRRQAQLLG